MDTEGGKAVRIGEAHIIVPLEREGSGSIVTAGNKETVDVFFNGLMGGMKKDGFVKIYLADGNSALNRFVKAKTEKSGELIMMDKDVSAGVISMDGNFYIGARDDLTHEISPEMIKRMNKTFERTGKTPVNLPKLED